MTLEEFRAAVEAHGDEYMEFDRIPQERRLSNRPDLNAFMLLDRLVPGTDDMVSSAEHDEFYLEVDPGKLAAVVSMEQLVDLIRCGVRYDHSYDCFAMFS